MTDVIFSHSKDAVNGILMDHRGEFACAKFSSRSRNKLRHKEVKMTEVPSTQTIAAIIIGAVVVLAALFLIIRRWRRRRRSGAVSMDEMEGHDFEFFCADLLRDAGFTDVEVTRGSGDFGADILAQKDGVTYAVQCKCYEGAVGVSAVQEVFAGRAFYDCMVGAVMTNQYFTGPAVTAARKLNILLWDRGFLDDIMQGE